MKRTTLPACVCCLLFLSAAPAQSPRVDNAIKVGAAAVEVPADDAMVIGGGIHAAFAKGQEGQLRAVAVVLEKPSAGKLALVACDVLFVPRDLLDPIVEEISKACDIPAAHLLINATHTHHAPTTATIHGYQRDELFCR